MRNSQQLCIRIKKYRNDTFRSNQKLNSFTYLTLCEKLALLPKILNTYFFDLKYTDYNKHDKYVVESPEILIRKLLSIRIEREKYVKASKQVVNMFFEQNKKKYFLPKSQNTQHASFGFGFRKSKISRNDKKILCIRPNHVLVEFY